MGGGGGGGTIESIPDWYKPYIETAAGDAVGAYKTGKLGQVADFNPLQEQAIEADVRAANVAHGNYRGAADAAGRTAYAAQTGEAAINPYSRATEGLKAKAAHDAQRAWTPTGDNLAARGGVGGIRGQLLQGERDAALGRQFAELDYGDYQKRQDRALNAAQQTISNVGQLNQLASQPGALLGQAGAAVQQQQQARTDSPFAALQQLGGLLSGAPVPTQAQRAGGGK